MNDSMINPSILSLLKKVDNRYTLAVVTSKRARQLIAGDERLSDCDSNKPVTIAINEINEGKITYESGKNAAS